MNQEDYPEPLDEKGVRRKTEQELDLEKGKIDKYLESGSVKFIEDYPPYIRFRRPLSGVEKGTNVFYEEEIEENRLEVVRGYPKTKRLLVIEEGMKKNFNSKVHVEEKLNGYNVRLAKVFDEIKALTRGGLDCPFTNEKLEKEKYEEFFSENPELMICGEIIGQNNPYVEKRYPEEKEFGYFAFDVRDKSTCVPIGVSEKKQILEEYDIPRVNEVGIFSPEEGKGVLEKVREMGKKGREGVVLKSRSMDKQLKYTANQSTNTDLEYAFRFWSNYGRDFMFRRIVREAFQAHEAGLEGEDLEKEGEELGKNILIPLVDTIKKVESGEEVTEDFTLEVPSKEFGEAYVEYLKHIGINAEIKSSEETSKGLKIEVSRKYPSTNDKTKHYLEGGPTKE